MRSDRLFSRDFTLMVAGQIISLFGNAILRFALSLYVLDTTGSAAAFGGILAVSMVPTILCSPLGGVLADRVPRQRIMWGLDFFTAALVLGYGLFFASRGTVLAVGVLMVLLAAIQALYQPSVQASIPALASEEHLPAANGVVAQVQALANLLGPILGGMLYGWVGLLPMVAVGGACFFCSAVMELFLRIPFQRRTLAGPPRAALWSDLRDAGRFLTREQPGLLRVLALVALLNLFLSALLVVGLSGYQAYFTPTSAISIDINPSVELEINRFDRVITVEGLNDDGTALAAELNVRFLSYDDALEQIIASDAIQQCLADDGVLSIVVSGDNEVQQQEILSCARRCTSGESNAHCYAGSSEDLAEAQALGLPLGKYHAYEELHALDPSITPEEAADMTMRELRDRIDACQDGDEEESYGGGGGQHQHGGRWNQHE